MPDFRQWVSRNRTAAIIVAAVATFVLVAVIILAVTQPDNLVGLVIMVVGAGLMFLPGIVASSRDAVHQGAIWVLAILLGWTVIGWVVALVWAIADPTTEQRRAAEARRAQMQAHAMMQAMQRPPPPGYPPPMRPMPPQGR